MKYSVSSVTDYRCFKKEFLYALRNFGFGVNVTECHNKEYKYGGGKTVEKEPSIFSERPPFIYTKSKNKKIHCCISS
jgi:hypothetical protein